MFRPKSLRLVNFLSYKDSFFEFRQGKPVLVIGQNLDDSGQRGNGSGKSGLSEGIALAVSGDSIRKCKPRELVRRGCEFGEVELVLYNTLYRCELKIYRKLYLSTSKSSECKIWENDEEVKSCPDINAYNKWIWSMLGITKEDFFSFYLVTKELYTPFFIVGDVKKKEIVNRFSGANVVDKTDDLIKADSQKLQIQIETKNKVILQSETRFDTYTEDLLVLQNAYSDETLKEQKEGIEKQIVEVEEEQLGKVVELQKQEDECWDLEQDLSNYPSDEVEVKELDKLNTQKLTLETEKVNTMNLSKEVSKEFETEINEIKETETTCNEELDKLKSKNTLDKKELKDTYEYELGQKKTSKSKDVKEKEDLENKLAGVIECPKCSHEFTLKYADFNVENAKKAVEDFTKSITIFDEEIKELEEKYNRDSLNLQTTYDTEKGELDSIIQQLDLDKKTINEKIIKKREGYQTRVTEIDKELLEISQKSFTLESKITKLKEDKTKLETQIKTAKTTIENSKKYIEQLELKVKSLKQSLASVGVVDKVKEDELNTKIQTELKIQGKEKGERDELIRQKQETDEWTINFKNFKSHLANQSITNITDYTNLFLQSIQSNITVKVEGYKVMSDKKLKEEITISVFKNGLEEGSYGTFSAGERGRIDVCCILGLQELINLNTPSGGLDLLICDEILDSIDELGMELLINSLQNLSRTILIVSQNQINSLKENTIVIQKQNKISTILNGDN